MRCLKPLSMLFVVVHVFGIQGFIPSDSRVFLAAGVWIYRNLLTLTVAKCYYKK